MVSLFWSSQTKNFRRKRDFLKGSPKFPNGISNRKTCRHSYTGTKYFKQEPIQRRFDFSDVLYFGWPNQPSSGTMRVYIELLLCTYI